MFDECTKSKSRGDSGGCAAWPLPGLVAAGWQRLARCCVCARPTIAVKRDQVPRVKGGHPAPTRHGAVLKINQGPVRGKHRCGDGGHEAMLKSLWYATRDRRDRKRDFRRLWIAPHQRCFAPEWPVLQRFMHGLKVAAWRSPKILADLARPRRGHLWRLAAVASDK